MFRPERLISARTLVGVTQSDLASASGVGQSMVSMVEQHQRDFSDELAEAFADALALPVEYFEVVPRSIPRDSLHYRKQSRARVTDTHRVHEHFSEVFRIAETLLDGSGYPRPLLPTVQDDVEILSVQRVDEIASQAREALQLDATAPISNVTRALERAGIVVAPLNIPGVTLDKHSGVSWSAGRGAAALVGVMQTSGDRDRFTLAHELGHIVLHSFRSSSDPEKEANLFAGAFLIPEPQVRSSISPEATLTSLRRAKANWGVSMQAILSRATAVGQVSQERSLTLWKQLSARGWRKNEPGEVGAETPRLLFKLMQERYGVAPFSNDRIARELALPLLMLRSLAPTPPTARVGSNVGFRPVANLPSAWQ